MRVKCSRGTGYNHMVGINEEAYLTLARLQKEFPNKRGLVNKVIIAGVQVVYEQLEHQREVSPIKEAWKDIKTEEDQ